MLKTLEELRCVIGKNIDDLQNDKLTDHQRTVVTERAEQTSNLAKQFNNMAKIVLNADQMSRRTDRIDSWIGEE